METQIFSVAQSTKEREECGTGAGLSRSTRHIEAELPARTRAHVRASARAQTHARKRTCTYSRTSRETERTCVHTRTHTRTHAHAPRRLTGVPRALRPLHIRRRSWDDTAEFICVGGRTPLRAQSPILRGSWRVPDPLVRSCDSLDRPAPENPHCCRLSWSTFLVSQCSSCHHRGNETAR